MWQHILQMHSGLAEALANRTIIGWQDGGKATIIEEYFSCISPRPLCVIISGSRMQMNKTTTTSASYIEQSDCEDCSVGALMLAGVSMMAAVVEI